jgi:hypothetical protein
VTFVELKVGLYDRTAAMTKLLQKALEAVQNLPPADQDIIAQAMLTLAGRDEPEDIDPAHLSAVLEGLDQIKRGEFATDQQVETVLHRLQR